MPLKHPFERALCRCQRRGGRKILIGWNRGLGDIALGLYAVVQRIRAKIPEAEIAFLTRENLREGFSLLKGVSCFVDPTMRRGETIEIRKRMRRLGLDPKAFDLILDTVSPTDAVSWQRGWLTPRLCWREEAPPVVASGPIYIGVQVEAETHYGLWRNWPKERFDELFFRLGQFPGVRVLLFGMGQEPKFPFPHVIDLRGKTSLQQLLSTIKNRCRALVLPDSGILSMVYYLDADFPIDVVSLWADPRHGILKQKVASPNRLLRHTPLFGKLRDLGALQATQVVDALFPAKPLRAAPLASLQKEGSAEKAGAILLAGGQGSRLGSAAPKGIFPVLGKPLFQWLVEKVPPLAPIAVMVSPKNAEETRAFFAKHAFFGREISFFLQGEAPFLDEEGKELSFLGSRGNGEVFSAFAKSGLLGRFKERGIDTVVVSAIDNPLADPLDLRLVGCLREKGADAVLKCIDVGEEKRSMGAVVEREGRLEVLEYFSLLEGEAYRYRYTGSLAFSLSFLAEAAGLSLPVHKVKKKIGGVEAYKQETLLFDVLPFAENASALCFDPKICYAPLKALSDLPEVERCLSAL